MFRSPQKTYLGNAVINKLINYLDLTHTHVKNKRVHKNVTS